MVVAGVVAYYKNKHHTCKVDNLIIINFAIPAAVNLRTVQWRTVQRRAVQRRAVQYRAAQQNFQKRVDFTVIPIALTISSLYKSCY